MRAKIPHQNNDLNIIEEKTGNIIPIMFPNNNLKKTKT